MRRQESILYSTDSFDSVIPAKQSKMSTPLNLSATSLTALSTDSSSETSTLSKRTVGLPSSPAQVARKCSTAFAPMLSSTSKIASLSTPCSSSALAQTRPRPCAPPVTGVQIEPFTICHPERFKEKTHRWLSSQIGKSAPLRALRGFCPDVGDRVWVWEEADRLRF